ncbi:MAG: patatin-like phospholipase family protein [Clostridia bacterium]|nr:patatin-like phospholipase family protein [Clostridia bacterium]
MKLGIALSGGGIRGIAHAGVLKALEDNKIKIDIIGGTSAGSLVAALYAMGYSPYYIYILFKRYAKEIAGINGGPIISGIGNFMMNKKNTFQGLKSGKNIETLYNQIAYKKGIRNINQIKMPIVIPTVDINNSKEYVITNHVPKGIVDDSQYITDITVGKAVRASSSFPAVFMPCEFEEHAFMDGGALDNVPVHEVKKQGADKVIAVKFDADQIDQTSNIMDIVMKTIDIMGSKISEESLEMSDFVLSVYTDKVGLLDIAKLDSCYQYGYNCTVENLDKIKQVLKN